MSRKYTFSKHGHVLAVLSALSRLTIRPTFPVRSVSAVLSQMSCTDVLTKPCCPVPTVLFQMPCLGNLVLSSPNAAVMYWKACPLCPFQAHLSRLTCPVSPDRPPFQTILSRLSCPGGNFPDVLSQLPRLSHPGCLVSAVWSLLSCSCCRLFNSVGSFSFRIEAPCLLSRNC